MKNLDLFGMDRSLFRARIKAEGIKPIKLSAIDDKKKYVGLYFMRDGIEWLVAGKFNTGNNQYTNIIGMLGSGVTTTFDYFNDNISLYKKTINR